MGLLNSELFFVRRKKKTESETETPINWRPANDRFVNEFYFFAATMVYYAADCVRVTQDFKIKLDTNGLFIDAEKEVTTGDGAELKGLIRNRHFFAAVTRLDALKNCDEYVCASKFNISFPISV